MSGQNRIINGELAQGNKKGEALVSALNEFNTDAATEDGCDYETEK
jgi:hypothetical protein